jgi:UDP-galactopyranose mutase
MLVPVPVNIQTVNQMYNLTIKTTQEMDKWLKSIQVIPKGRKAKNGAEAAKARVGVDLYEKIFKEYTVKQWNKQPEDLDASVLERIPVRNNWDDRYFTDQYQALPSKGYTAMFEKILNHTSIEVALNTDYFHYKKNIPGEEKQDVVFFTGPIDFYFADVGQYWVYFTMDYRCEHRGKTGELIGDIGAIG